MKCELSCPFPFTTEKAMRNIRFCCSHCEKSRKQYLSDNPELKKHWDKDSGFASDKGCRLSRDEMPKVCKEYDCRDYDYNFVLKWTGSKWEMMPHAKKVR